MNCLDEEHLYLLLKAVRFCSEGRSEVCKVVFNPEGKKTLVVFERSFLKIWPFPCGKKKLPLVRNARLPLVACQFNSD